MKAEDAKEPAQTREAAADDAFEVMHDLSLVASHTAYVKWGKGPRTPLRFTKTGDERLEKVYARHFVWPGKGPFHPPREKSDAGRRCPEDRRRR